MPRQPGCVASGFERLEGGGGGGGEKKAVRILTLPSKSDERAERLRLEITN